MYVELASANGGMMRDLSDEGFAVRAMMPLHAGEKVPFAFSLNEYIRIEGQGQILWVRENGHVAGVQFAEVAPSARELIREWLTQRVTPRREQAAEPQNPTLDQLREEMHSVPPRPEGKSAVQDPAKPEAPEPAALAKQPEGHSAPPCPEPPRVPEAPVTAEQPEVHSAATRLEEKRSGDISVAPSVSKPTAVIVEPTVIAREPDRHSVPSSPKERIPVEVATTPRASQSAERPILEPAITAKELQPAPTKEPDRVASIPPAAIPPAAIPIEVGPAAGVPAASLSAAGAAGETRPQRPPVPAHAPETDKPTESPLEEPRAPELPRLTLTPKRVDPRFQPIVSALPLTEEASAPRQLWKPAPLVEVNESEAKAEEPEPALPDVSSILIQPQGRPQRPASPPASVEGPASWDAEPASTETWTERFSLSFAVTVMTILALLGGLYVFHKDIGQGLIWLGEALGGVPQTPVAARSSNTGVVEAPAETPSPQPDTSMRQFSPPANSNAPENALGAKSANDLNASATGPSPSMVPLSGIHSPLDPNAEVGQSEYTQAMRLLGGKEAGAATPEAIRLLWNSVEKGNASAELQLAEMYWKGRGVVQNCDQALILLTAAARKGSAEAEKRLQEFHREGCE